MKKFFIFTGLFFTISIPVFADSANIGGYGNTVKILDNNDIKMSAETIIINMYQGEELYVDSQKEDTERSEIEVTYTFKNQTAKEVTVQMGFPELCEAGGYYCWESDEYHDPEAPNSPPYKLFNFKVLEGDEELPVEFRNDKDVGTEGTNWYIYEVTFAPNEEKEITNSYWIYPSSYREGSRWIYYILETGASWEDYIDQVDIYVYLNDELSLYDIDNIEGPDNYILNTLDNSIEWHLTALEPTEFDNITIYYTDYSEPFYWCEMTAMDYEYFEIKDTENASSTLLGDAELSYVPCQAYDNEPGTAWVEGAEGDGIGEWIKIPLSPDKNYEKVKIFTGYGFDDDNWAKDLWEKNNRIKTAKLTFTNGIDEATETEISEQTIEIADIEDYQKILLDEEIKGATSVKLEILEVYKGTKYDDTCLSEIRFLGYPIKTYAFTDIENNEYESEISYIKDQGIVQGYDDGSFKPDNKINRAELTKIIVEAAYPWQAEGSNCFPDVKEEWYAKYICFAKNHQIVNGYPDGNFKPENNINYVEAIKIALIAFNYAPQLETDPWYQGFLDVLEEMSTSVPDTSNDELITRGKMAKLIYGILVYKNNF